MVVFSVQSAKSGVFAIVEAAVGLLISSAAFFVRRLTKGRIRTGITPESTRNPGNVCYASRCIEMR
jgi:hypothetical protein